MNESIPKDENWKFLNVFNEQREKDMVGFTVQRCSVKEVFLEISQNSQENTCATASFLIKRL